MTKLFDRVMEGLGEALEYSKGATVSGMVVHVPDRIDVAAIRRRTRLSQPAFALTMGVSVGPLRGWEQDRRRPDGPARVLLALLDRNPSVVLETLGQGRERE